MVRPLTILLVPNSNVLAHFGRTLLLARALSARGHRAVLASSPVYLSDPRIVEDGSGFEPYILPEIDTAFGLRVIRSPHRRIPTGLLHTLVDADLRMLDRIQPDVAIIDERMSFYISARVTGVPTISLLGSWIFPELTVYPSDEVVRSFSGYCPLRRLLGERGANRIMSFLFRRILRYKVAPFIQEQRARGVRQPEEDPFRLFHGDLNLIVEPPSWNPLKPPLPSNIRVVGALWFEIPGALPPEFEKSERPSVYATLGSTAHRALYRTLLAVLGKLPIKAVLTTGGQFRHERVIVPTNVRVADFLPGGQLMQRAMVGIHHGGAGSAYQAIVGETPTLVVPTHFEQEYVAGLVERHRIGRSLPMPEAVRHPERLQAALLDLLEHPCAYRTGIRSLRDEILHSQPLATAVHEVEQFIARRGEGIA